MSRETYARRPATSDRLTTIRPKEDVVRCTYCNRQIVRGTIAIIAHEEYCPDRVVVERQRERAVNRFKRKQAGFA